MCGIAGFYIKDPDAVKRHEAMEKFADVLLLGIEDRGKRATGFVAHTAGGHDLVFNKGALPATEFIEVRERLPAGCRVALLHTRYDTKGSPKHNDNNHPVICGSTFVTHNGGITNDDKLWKEYKDAKRKAKVDSSAIALVLHKAGLHEPEDALEKLEGSFAIASIDPIDHPDTLLLAKGYQSPLVIHESEKFVVWASTKAAIEDAWKVVLGTPPKHNTYKYAQAGDFYLVTEDGVEARKFEAYRPPTQTYRSTETTETTGSTCAVGERPRVILPGEHTQGAQPLGRFKDSVREMRKLGRGQAITWEDWHTGKKSVPADVERKWSYCKSCQTAVLDSQINPTLAWGEVCVDCYAVGIANMPHQQNPAKTLTDDEKRTIENWASLEANVHRDALAQVSADTLLDEDAIDFLIFRVPKEYTDKQPKVAKLSEELDSLYQAALEDSWAGFGVEDAETLRYSSEDSADAQPSQPRALPPGDSQQNNEAVVYSMDTYRKRMDSFLSPRARLLRLAQSPDLSIKGCIVCKHRTKFHMMKWAWCGKHFTACTNPGCSLSEDTAKGKYPIKAICTAPDGRRLCHFCSRNEKGLIYDREHADLRIEVAERTSS